MNMQAIFFHKDQLLKLKRFQDKIVTALLKENIKCMPLFPLIIKNISPESISKQTQIIMLPQEKDSFFKENYSKNETLSINVQIKGSEGNELKKIELVQILENRVLSHEKLRLLFPSFTDALTELSPIKVLSPFRLAEAETEQAGGAFIWKTFSEKWFKGIS